MNSLSVLSFCLLVSLVVADVPIDSYNAGVNSTSTNQFFAFTFLPSATTTYQFLSANVQLYSDKSSYAYGKAYLFNTNYTGTPSGLSTSSYLARGIINSGGTAWVFTPSSGSITLSANTLYNIYIDTANTKALAKRQASDSTHPTFSTADSGKAFKIINSNKFNFAVAGSICGNNVTDTGETCDGTECCSPTCTKAPSTQRCVGDNRCKYCSGTSTACSANTPVPSSYTCGKCATGGATAYCSGSSSDPRCGISCTAGTINDPLVMGFHHQQFYFDGEADQVFNMLSQPHLAINGLFKAANGRNSKRNTIIIGEAGIVTQNNKLSFTVDSGRKGIFNWNGQTITLNSATNVADLNDCVQLTWSPSTSIMLTSPSFEIVIAFKDQLPSEKINVDYLNIKLVHISGADNQMGGVIGQTALYNATISQVASDFQVSNLLATDSVRNTYTAAAIECAEKRDHAARFSASFEHGLDEQHAYESYDA